MHSPFSLARGRHGFTLLELLIATAILGLLTAIAGLHYLDSIGRADAAKCQQQLRTIHTALLSYRLDHNRFPPADGTADTQPQPDETEWGCGPAANGYWSGVSLLLVKGGYCTEETLYCPALQRAYHEPVVAFSTCAESGLAGRVVPHWRFLRYAYNAAAADAGAFEGGESNIERDVDREQWLVRCAHLDPGTFDPDRAIRFPFRVKADEDHPDWTWYGEFELTLQGNIRLRPVQLRKGR